jgi:hypothetical protein
MNRDNSNSIFSINERGLLEINKPEAREVPEYKALIARDKGSEGDADGKKKLKAFLELLYIYLILDPRSMYYNFSIQERREKAVKHCGLKSGTKAEWKEDDLIRQAMIRYEMDLKLDSTANAYLAAEKNLHNTAESIHDIQNSLADLKRQTKNFINKLSIQGEGGLGDVERINNITQVNALLNEMIKIQLDTNKIIKELPNMDEIKNKLYASYAETGGSKKLVIGNRELGNREL